MKFTRAAREMLDTITDQDRIAEIGNYAKRLAEWEGRDQVTKADVLAATLVAGPEFLPDPPTGQNR